MLESKTEEDLKTLVHIASLKRWKDLKQVSLIRYIIPFLPANFEGAKKMFDYYVSQQLASYRNLRRRHVSIEITYVTTPCRRLTSKGIQTATKC